MTGIPNHPFCGLDVACKGHTRVSPIMAYFPTIEQEKLLSYPKKYSIQPFLQVLPKRWLIHACLLLNPSAPLCLCPFPHTFTGKTQTPPMDFPSIASDASTQTGSLILLNGAHVTRLWVTPVDGETRSPMSASAFTDDSTKL